MEDGPINNDTIRIEDLFDRAFADHQVGRLQAAERGYRQYLAAAPDEPNASHLLGVLLHQTGRSDAAIVLIERAIARLPAAAHFQINLGNILRDTGRAEDALAWYRRALPLAPEIPDLHHNVGKTLLALGRLADAETALRRAMQLDPNHVDAQHDLGSVLCYTGRDDQALDCFTAAMQLRPGDARGHNNLGRALIGLNRFEEAAKQLRAAVRLQPDYAKAWFNLGTLLDATQQWDEAAECWRQVLKLEPDDAEAHVSLGLMLLKIGRLRDGWPELQWFRHLRRRNDDSLEMEFPPPTWSGGDTGGEALVLYSDQGLGDAIQFCRYVPLCARRAPVILVVQHKLRPLLVQLDGVLDVISEPPLPKSYLHCPLSQLPGIFGTELHSIPATEPYLQADRRQAAIWRDRLAPLDGLRVGLVWAGNPKHLGDHNRSIALRTLMPFVDLPDVRLVSLQKGPAAGQIQSLPEPAALHDWMDQVGDLAATAALIDGLDLVISVDTSVAHLAGALGKPVWLLNRFDTDWRWMLDREDSPWYPTVRLFRQKSAGDWQDPLRRVRDELARLAPGAWGPR